MATKLKIKTNLGGKKKINFDKLWSISISFKDISIYIIYLSYRLHYLVLIIYMNDEPTMVPWTSILSNIIGSLWLYNLWGFL